LEADVKSGTKEQVTAPVSLAEIRKLPLVGGRYGSRVMLLRSERDALVELAEACLDTRPGIHDSCRESCKDPAQCDAKRQAAHDRLVMAAKAVSK